MDFVGAVPGKDVFGCVILCTPALLPAAISPFPWDMPSLGGGKGSGKVYLLSICVYAQYVCIDLGSLSRSDSLCAYMLHSGLPSFMSALPVRAHPCAWYIFVGLIMS